MADLKLRTGTDASVEPEERPADGTLQFITCNILSQATFFFFLFFSTLFLSLLPSLMNATADGQLALHAAATLDSGQTILGASQWTDGIQKSVS